MHELLTQVSDQCVQEQSSTRAWRPHVRVQLLKGMANLVYGLEHRTDVKTGVLYGRGLWIVRLSKDFLLDRSQGCLATATRASFASSFTSSLCFRFLLFFFPPYTPTFMHVPPQQLVLYTSYPFPSLPAPLLRRLPLFHSPTQLLDIPRLLTSHTSSPFHEQTCLRPPHCYASQPGPPIHRPYSP